MCLDIIIGADIVPTNNNISNFSEGKLDNLIDSDLKIILEQADYTIFNLETPLVDNCTPIKKSGVALQTPRKCINGISKLNPHFFTLANNHIMDQGEQGLLSTIKILEKYNIAYSGVGENRVNASKPFVFEKNGFKVGIYCCAEHEFSIAGEYDAGANPYDPLESFDHVSNLKEACDFVIVLFHGGREHYRYPTPNTQKIFRKFSDKGADLVVAQHTHCVGCEEIYNNSTLVYGQGNFLFSMNDNEYWNNSILIKLHIDETGHKITYIPLVDSNGFIKTASEVESKKIIENFNDRSIQIVEEGFVEKKFTEYVKTQSKNYSKVIRGEKSIVKRLIMKYSNKDYNFLYSEERLFALLNFIECETHREIVLNGIKKSLNLSDK